MVIGYVRLTDLTVTIRYDMEVAKTLESGFFWCGAYVQPSGKTLKWF